MMHALKQYIRQISIWCKKIAARSKRLLYHLLLIERLSLILMLLLGIALLSAVLLNQHFTKQQYLNMLVELQNTEVLAAQQQIEDTFNHYEEAIISMLRAKIFDDAMQDIITDKVNESMLYLTQELLVVGFNNAYFINNNGRIIYSLKKNSLQGVNLQTLSVDSVLYKTTIEALRVQQNTPYIFKGFVEKDDMGQYLGYIAIPLANKQGAVLLEINADRMVKLLQPHNPYLHDSITMLADIDGNIISSSAGVNTVFKQLHGTLLELPEKGLQHIDYIDVFNKQAVSAVSIYVKVLGVNLIINQQLIKSSFLDNWEHGYKKQYIYCILLFICTTLAGFLLIGFFVHRYRKLLHKWYIQGWDEFKILEHILAKNMQDVSSSSHDKVRALEKLQNDLLHHIHNILFDNINIAHNLERNGILILQHLTSVSEKKEDRYTLNNDMLGELKQMHISVNNIANMFDRAIAQLTDNAIQNIKYEFPIFHSAEHLLYNIERLLEQGKLFAINITLPMQEHAIIKWQQLEKELTSNMLAIRNYLEQQNNLHVTIEEKSNYIAEWLAVQQTNNALIEGQFMMQQQLLTQVIDALGSTIQRFSHVSAEDKQLYADIARLESQLQEWYDGVIALSNNMQESKKRIAQYLDKSSA